MTFSKLYACHFTIENQQDQSKVFMGVKCCRPAIRQDPKNDYLLSTIYSDIQEAVKIPSFEEAIAYLSKKGHIKTLGDYLSSHLSKILPSIMICKNKIFSVRNKSGSLQMLYCCITSQILSKIIYVVKESKNKHQGRSKIQQKADNSESDSNDKEREFNFQKGNSKRLFKYEADELTLIDNEIVFHVVETCFEVVKQTLVSKKILTIQNGSLEVQHFEFKIILSVQQTLWLVLDKQGSFIKGNNSITKEILDQLILIINRCSTSIHKENFPPSMFLSPMLKNQNKFRKERQEMKQVSSNSNSQIFKQGFEDKKRLLKQCLSNYYKILKKGNNYIVNSNIFQQIIKFHFSYFLDFWQNLTGQQQSIDLAQISSKDIEFLLQSIFLEYFHSFSSHRQSEQVYKQLLHLFDKLSFKNSRMFPIEKLLFTTLKNYELKKSIICKLFDYMLNYITIVAYYSSQTPVNFSGSYRVSPTVKQSNYLRQLSLDECLESYKVQFPNWHKKQNVIGCMQTLKRWIQQKSMDLQDMLKYKSSKIVTSVLINFAWGSSEINKQIAGVIATLTQKNVNYYLYLSQTAVSFINLLKFEDFLEENDYSWNFFLQQYRVKKQNQYSRVVKNENTKKPFTSSENNFYIKNNYQQTKISIQLTSPINFINQVILIASYPRFNEIRVNIPKQEYAEPQTFIRRSTSYLNEDNIGSEYRSSSNRRTKKKNSQIILKQKYQESDSIKQSCSFYPSLFLIPSIFEEIAQTIFMNTEAHRFTINNYYRMKLLSIYIATNLKQMLSSLSYIGQKYAFNLLLLYIKKLNKLLVSILSSITYLSLSSAQLHQIKSKIVEVTEAEREVHENQQNSHFIEQAFQKLLKCLQDWVYPSILFVLNQKVQEDQGYLRSTQMSTRIQEQLSALLTMSFKVYVKKLAECSSQILTVKFHSLIEHKQSPSSSSQSIFNFGFEKQIKAKNNISLQLFSNQQKRDSCMKLLSHFFQTVLIFRNTSSLFANSKRGPQEHIQQKQETNSLLNKKMDENEVISTISIILRELKQFYRSCESFQIQVNNSNHDSIQKNSILSTSCQKEEDEFAIERKEAEKLKSFIQKSIELLNTPYLYSVIFNFIDSVAISGTISQPKQALVFDLLTKQTKLERLKVQRIQDYPEGCLFFQNMFTNSSQVHLGIQSFNREAIDLTSPEEEKSMEGNPDALVNEFCHNYSEDLIPKIIDFMLQKYINVEKWEDFARKEYLIKGKNSINIKSGENGFSKEDSAINSSELQVTVEQNSFHFVVGMMKEY